MKYLDAFLDGEQPDGGPDDAAKARAFSGTCPLDQPAKPTKPPSDPLVSVLSVSPPRAALLATPVPALRRALRAWYAMTAQEAEGDLPTIEEARALLSEIRRLWDDVGPAFAEAVERQEAKAFYREMRRCPHCGEPAIFHGPGPDGSGM